MNTRRKISLLTLTALVTILALSVSASGASAESDFTTAITSTNPTVGDSATYTFTITYTGTANLTGANITIPSGYTPGAITNLAVTDQPAGQKWNASVLDSTIVLGSDGSVLTSGQSVVLTFNAVNAQIAGGYNWETAASTGASTPSTVSTTYTLLITSILPALAVLGIAAAIAFLNTGVNRLLIGYFIGWEQYRVMQKEMAEFRSEQMAAARANDKKQLEKLKKKQSQINNMQTKMFKPQMLQIGISFIYLIVWFLVLIPTFQSVSMAYLPGFGPLPVVWLYPIVSMFLGILASRIIGVMPIENV
ncbi:MAG: EMC3/TMCO1 family protein [Candidatus Bathyarchaeia archaeon]|jgi:uncharacterized membrane protein (DUF106 family)